jgi:outer membrane protein OmpA-like peptidoglycan-associated protein
VRIVVCVFRKYAIYLTKTVQFLLDNFVGQVQYFWYFCAASTTTLITIFLTFQNFSMANRNENKKRRRGAALTFPLMLVGFLVLCAVFGAAYLVFWRDTTPHIKYKSAFAQGTNGMAAWDNDWCMDSDTCGALESGKRIGSFKMELDNLPASANISYAGYVHGLGWQEGKNGSEIVPMAQNLVADSVVGIEAIKATLTNAPGYTLEYRAHFTQAGWTEWLGDGILVGSPKSADFMDALQARLVVADSTVAEFDAKTGAHVDFSAIYFKAGSEGFNFELPETARNLARVYKFVNESCDSLQVAIEGHSSSEGEAAVNQRLSEQRAGKVRDWLVSKGVNPTKISSIKGFGSSQPKVAEPPTGSVSAGELEIIRKQNRRIGMMIERGCK